MLNSMAQRADVVVFDREARPLLLAECKASDIDFKQRDTISNVFQQATRYNAILKARYLLITNGLQHFCYEATTDGYKALRAFPDLG